MKYFFLSLWFVFAATTLPFSIYAIYRAPASIGPYMVFLGCGFIALCTLRLIQEGYRTPYFSGKSRLGFWLGLLLLPLTLLPLHSAYQTWQRGYYLAPETRRGRLLHLALESLQQWVGPWGPILVQVAFALVIALLLVKYVLCQRS